MSFLKYPKKSHRKKICIPRKSADLAEFIGIMLGDGGINNPWQVTITVNSVSDKEYADYIKTLSKKLFCVSPSFYKRKERNALVIRLSSTTIVEFLNSLGIVSGNKLKQGLRIPAWVLEKKSYRKACVRGLMDTDGCLYIHKHNVSGKQYQNIGLTFCSYSPELLFQVSRAFEEFGIMPHISKRGREISIYSAKDIDRYLLIFGTSNERLKNVYKKWKGG